MDYETILGQAIDAMADDDTTQSETLLQALIDHIKASLDGSLNDVEGYYAWGRALRLMDEPEQALLRLEQALGLNSDHEGVLWETASILLDDLDRASVAQTLLETRLLPMRPDEDLYKEALDMAKLRQRMAKSPPEAPGEKQAGGTKARTVSPLLEDDSEGFDDDDSEGEIGDDIDLSKGKKKP